MACWSSVFLVVDLMDGNLLHFLSEHEVHYDSDAVVDYVSVAVVQEGDDRFEKLELLDLFREGLGMRGESRITLFLEMLDKTLRASQRTSSFSFWMMNLEIMKRISVFSLFNSKSSSTFDNFS